MSTSVDASECPPLIEACTLELYQRNIFRITGLPVDATTKEVARQAQKLQMLEEMGSGDALSPAAFPLSPPPSREQIRQALARMKEPEHRLVDEFFWYWPETFGESKSDPAIQALQAGDGQKAVDLWVERENAGSWVAKHNLAIMFHMYAVDWTNHHVEHDIDEGRDEKIQDYWNDAFSRWEVLAGAEELWEPLKERVRALDDEALTTGFVRRMRRVLPQALDRVNAEAALKFADLGQMEWATFHVEMMRQSNQGADDVESTAALVLEPTRRRVEQRIQTARSEVEKNPKSGMQVSAELMNHCEPLRELFGLFHGTESHHRNDLFDSVADAVLFALQAYYKATEDNRTFVDLLKQALTFATSAYSREWLLKNIAFGEGNLKDQEVAAFIASMDKIINDATLTPAAKLQQLRAEILPQMPVLAQGFAADSNDYKRLLDSAALAVRSLFLAAHNDHEDFPTAQAAIMIAVNLAVSPEVRMKMQVDEVALAGNKRKFLCFFCGTEPADKGSKLELAMHGNVTRYHRRVEFSTLNVPISRCATCEGKHGMRDKIGWLTMGLCVVLCVARYMYVDAGMWLVGAFSGLFFGWLLSKVARFIVDRVIRLRPLRLHAEVRRMKQNGWRIGERP